MYYMLEISRTSAAMCPKKSPQVAFAAPGLPWRRRSPGRRPVGKDVALGGAGGAAVGGAGRCAATPGDGSEAHRVVDAAGGS